MGSSLYNVMLWAMRAAASYGSEELAARSATPRRAYSQPRAAEPKEAYDPLPEAAA